MWFGPKHPEIPDWGNSTPEGKIYRRIVTNKWAASSFWASVSLLALIILCNTFLGPTLFTLVNERPTKRPRQVLLYTPWMKIAMWLITAFLIFAASVQTNGFDIVFVAKRLGRMIVALMPAMYLLTLRPSPLPRTFYLHVVSVHKFISRFVVIITVLHGVIYGYYYYKTNVFSKMLKRDNQLGLYAFIIFVLMGLTGALKFRRRFYECFYQFHIVGAWICLPMLHYHSRPRSDGYLLMCAVLLVFQVAAKLLYSSNTKIRVQYISQTMLLIDIPKERLRGSCWSWSVASHLRLSRSILNPLNWVRSSHPYTIASLPEDGSLKLVIRPGDFKIQMRREYTVFGPHSCLPNYLLKQIHSLMVSRVLMVIGGAGIAFGAPLMRYLRMHGALVRLVWVTRDPYDARVLPQIGLHEETLDGNIEIYYTGDALNLSDLDEDEMLTIGTSDNCCDEDRGGMGTIRSATRHPGVASRRVRADPVLSQYALFMANSRPHLNMRLKSWLYGYQMGANECCCADRIVDSCAEDRLGAWVMSCGNEQLSETARQWAENAGVCYFADSFTL